MHRILLLHISVELMLVFSGDRSRRICWRHPHDSCPHFLHPIHEAQTSNQTRQNEKRMGKKDVNERPSTSGSRSVVGQGRGWSEEDGVHSFGVNTA
jgi:hypothetical protein